MRDARFLDLISIHSLRMEGDGCGTSISGFRNKFQSTPSAWRETCCIRCSTCSCVAFQSTPSAWRETDLPCHRSLHPTHFNPLPPHGGRQGSNCKVREERHFNPLPPHGGRLACSGGSSGRLVISIHSLRMEGDNAYCHGSCPLGNFNPLPPHGGRRTKQSSSTNPKNFNPLPPHGGRRMTLEKNCQRRYFNPLPPHGGRLACSGGSSGRLVISIHSLRMEGDIVY